MSKTLVNGTQERHKQAKEEESHPLIELRMRLKFIRYAEGVEGKGRKS